MAMLLLMATGPFSFHDTLMHDALYQLMADKLSYDIGSYNLYTYNMLHGTCGTWSLGLFQEPNRSLKRSNSTEILFPCHGQKRNLRNLPSGDDQTLLPPLTHRQTRMSKCRTIQYVGKPMQSRIFKTERLETWHLIH